MKHILTIILLLTNMAYWGVAPVSAKQKAKEKDFISLAYVWLPALNMHNLKPAEVNDMLDRYNWNGISDVSLIGGVFLTGKDGSIITAWNKEEWPAVFEGIDYKGDSINEQRHRDQLCSKKVLKKVVKYFKKKGINIWICQTAYSWITGGSIGVVVEDHDMTMAYAKRLNKLAREFGCTGIDFDWEFPPTPRQAQGYRELMQESKRLGMKVSVCAIEPTVGNSYLDNCTPEEAGINNNHEARYMKWEDIIDQEMVDYINVMQYLGYNPKTKQMDVNVKYKKMNVWEKAYPQEFTDERKVKMLCGIGYYSFMLPEAKKGKKIQGKGTLNYNQLYEKYGKSAYTDRVVGGEHAVWTTDDVRDIVKTAKAKGWSGVFTWVVSHDFTLEHPLKYNRQQALAEEVEKIWKEECKK